MAKRPRKPVVENAKLSPKLYAMMAAITLATFGTLVQSYELLFPGTSAVFVA